MVFRAALAVAALVSVAAADLGPLTRVFDTSPKPDKSILNIGYYTAPTDSVTVQELPKWDWPQADVTSPFTTRISTVRILGGWEGDSVNQTGDLAIRDADGSVRYRWNLLTDRLDPILAIGLTPLLVLDNVPWCLSDPSLAVGTYGNVHGAQHQEELSDFIVALVRQLLDSYGSEAVSAWEFRIGTEPNCPCHWQDGEDAFLTHYRTVANAVWSVLPSARLGPGNFANSRRNSDMFDPSSLVRSIAEVGPVTSLGLSFYASVRKDDKSAGTPRLAYTPKIVQDAIAFLRSLKQQAGANASAARLEFMEYGLLTNDMGRRSDEPGSFGAAWHLMALSQARHGEIHRLFKWAYFDHLGTGSSRRQLWNGLGWLLAMQELGVGHGRSISLWPSQLLPADADSAFSGVTAHGVVSWDVDAQEALVLLGAYNTSDYYVTIPVEMPVSVDLSLSGLATGAAPLVVEQWQLDPGTSPFDAMYRDLAARSGLQHADGRTYKIMSMATADGMKWLQANAETYFAMQAASLSPDGSLAGAFTPLAQGGLGVSVSLPVQSVRAIRMRWGSIV